MRGARGNANTVEFAEDITVVIAVAKFSKGNRTGNLPGNLRARLASPEKGLQRRIERGALVRAGPL
jgi:hypothetical protein